MFASNLQRYTLTGFTRSENEYINTGFAGRNTTYARQDWIGWRALVAMSKFRSSQGVRNLLQKSSDC